MDPEGDSWKFLGIPSAGGFSLIPNKIIPVKSTLIPARIVPGVPNPLQALGHTGNVGIPGICEFSLGKRFLGRAEPWIWDCRDILENREWERQEKWEKHPGLSRDTSRDGEFPWDTSRDGNSLMTLSETRNFHFPPCFIPDKALDHRDPGNSSISTQSRAYRGSFPREKWICRGKPGQGTLGLEFWGWDFGTGILWLGFWGWDFGVGISGLEF